MKNSRSPVKILLFVLGGGLLLAAVLIGGKFPLMAGETDMTSQDVPAVEGVWIISSAKGVKLSDYDEIMFQFDQGTLYGNSPCRSFNSEYRFDDGRLRILRPEVFGSSCSKKAMDAESAFLELLTQTEDARVDEAGGLVLESFGEVIMQAKRKDD